MTARKTSALALATAAAVLFASASVTAGAAEKGKVKCEGVNTAEEHALLAARAAEPFGEICAVLCDHVREDEAPARAAEFLRAWIDGGLITALSWPA